MSGNRRRFAALEQTAFQSLEHAAYLKGLLKPFKGKGSLDDWASRCTTLRDSLVDLAQRSVVPQACSYPFSLLDVKLAQQTTGAGTTFLRWRNADRSRMGVTLWEQLVADPATPASLICDLYAIEEQRLVINMQVSVLHTIVRQARTCATKLAAAERVCRGRMEQDARGMPS